MTVDSGRPEKGEGIRDKRGRFTEGNPGGKLHAGKPRRSLVAALHSLFDDLEAGKATSTPEPGDGPLRLLAKTWYRSAMDSRDPMRAMESMLNRIDGPVVQRVEMDNDVEFRVRFPKPAGATPDQQEDPPE